MNHESDWELVARCLAGSTGAFEPLVRRYEGPALVVARSMLGDPDEAADAVQDAFVRAYRTLGRLRPGSSFGPWFRAILRNLCLDRLRSPRRRGQSLDQTVVDRRVWSEPSGAVHAERQELSAVVQAALRELSAEHREVLVLKEMEGFGYDEIAKMVGVPKGTVGSRLFHARAALQEVLLAQGVTLEDVR
jgi:RNA polymerase sigma-70 factor (ECF subfamily)